MSDQDLMQRIYNDYNPLITAASSSAPVWPILGAIVANESGGNPDASRFEPAVFSEISDVLLGRKTFYNPPGIKHPLGLEDFIGVINPAQLESPGSRFSEPPTASGFQTGLARLELLATSRGLTQIMGWHCIEFAVPLSTLTNPAIHLKLAAGILAYFAQRYDILIEVSSAAAATALLTCWNTGRPNGTTFDPQYVPNGLARMKIYQNLIDAAALHNG